MIPKIEVDANTFLDGVAINFGCPRNVFYWHTTNRKNDDFVFTLALWCFTCDNRTKVF
ncbi:hypothetical protein [Vibrio vulnificus YJ016]|uniref:Uncharacterized protein n=1 Tax=Vibrio vulnificus (strain YJ016) TaxID=196600 RepID=Q7ML63_VIBVY|nr:hypothetical protein [Vibrio vulnificus YJ016]